MKKILYILILLFLWTGNSANSQRMVSLNLQQQPLTKLLQEIQQQSGYDVYFLPAETDSVIISAKYIITDPLKILNEVLKNTTLKASVYQQQIYILKDKLISTTFPVLVDGFIQKKDTDNIAGNIPNRESVQIAKSEYKLYEIGRPGQTGAVRLSGKVRHFKTNETVAGASIRIGNTNIGTTTDNSGNYAINLQPGFYELIVSGMGIKETKRQIKIHGSGRLDIETQEEIYQMAELTILSSRLNKVKETSLGVERFKIKEIKNIPAAFGEVDVLKAVLALPGVKSSGEVSSGFNVRGSASDQNLILLNHSTIFNPTHLFGMLSVFNPDMVDDMELYMSNIPAKHGGRIASVLDVSSRKGDSKKISGSASLGLLTSRINIEGPLGSEKTTFIAGVRASYSDWLLGLIPEKSGYNKGSAGFYDFNGSIRHQFNDENTVTLHGYFSNDQYSFQPEEGFSYQNLNLSAEWRHVIQPQLFSKFILGYDSYSNSIANTENPYNAFELSTAIKQVHARADFDWYAAQDHSVNFGISMNGIRLDAGNLKPENELSLIIPASLQKQQAIESAIYISDEWVISPKFALNAGLRYSFYQLLGPRTYYNYIEDYLPSIGTLTDTVDFTGTFLKNYQGPEIRISARYVINDDLSVKAGFNTMRQNIHKISNATVMAPTDTWKLSDMHISPQSGIQLAGGIFKNFMNNQLNAAVEFYYKTTDNYLDYRSGAQLIMNEHLETEVVGTEGRAYGIELSLKKPNGKLNGWISYAYARTMLRQSNPLITNPVNKGDWYPADIDKPHDFKLVGNYKLTHRYSFSCNVFYSTGRPITLPVSKYKFSGGEYIYYSDRNQQRIPDYFRFDASFNVEPSHHLILLTHSTLSVGVYNLTGRDNVYSVYYKAEKGKLKGYQLSIFGAAIPYISYNIKF